MQVHTISDEEVLQAISWGEFPPSVLSAEDRVCIIMTQDWCPRWKRMQRWLYGVPAHPGVALFELVYNQIAMFEQFLYLKETRWKNGRIPYLRYYRGGYLANESNYVSQEEFLSLLKE